MMRTSGCRPMAGLLALWVAVVLVQNGGAGWKRSGDDGASKGTDQGVQREYKQTFLDTVNAGHEVSLTRGDFVPVAVSVVEPAVPGRTPPVAGTKAVFHIQCIASSQIETVLAEKKSLEARVDLPVYLVENPPFYKLLLGDFETREGAKDVLIAIKGLGYKDAWVVKSSTVPMP